MIPALSPFLDFSDFSALFPNGKNSSKIFQHERQEFFGFDYSISFSSARAGIYQILKSHNINNKIVLVSAYTCSAVIEAICNSGNKPAFVDLDSESFNITITNNHIESFQGQLGAVILTGMFGMEPSLPVTVPTNRDWLLIYDAALAPATLQAQVAASTDYTILSCCIRKPFTCLGGGLVFTDDQKKFNILSAYCHSDMTEKDTLTKAKKWLLAAFAFAGFAPGIYTLLDVLRRNTKIIGKMVHPADKDQDYNQDMYEFQKRIGIRHLQRLRSDSLHRQKLGNIYYDELSPHYPQVKKFWRKDTVYSHIPFLHPQRDALRGWLRQRGIDSDTVFDYVAAETADNVLPGKYSRSRFVADSIINLPINRRLTMKHVKDIADAIRSFDTGRANW